MTNISQTAYDRFQGALSYLVLISLAMALTFTVEHYNLLAVSDLSEWGARFMPPFIATAWTVFAIAVIAKAWGAWVQYRFWYRIDLAKALRRLADRVDPR
jgi:hypothetical protein